MYLSYDEYQDMGGTLNETAFNAVEFEAECLVDWYTFNRFIGEDPNTYPDKLSQCMYALIRLIDRKNAILFPDDSSISAAGAIASQSNDGVSVSYVTLSATNLLTSCKTEIANTIQQALHGVTNSLGRKVLYRGLYPGE